MDDLAFVILFLGFIFIGYKFKIIIFPVLASLLALYFAINNTNEPILFMVGIGASVVLLWLVVVAKTGGENGE